MISLYEKLRDIALVRKNGSGDFGSYGMAVFCNKGMLSWLELCMDTQVVNRERPPATVQPKETGRRYDNCSAELRNAFAEIAIRMIRKEYQLCRMTEI